MKRPVLYLFLIGLSTIPPAIIATAQDGTNLPAPSKLRTEIMTMERIVSALDRGVEYIAGKQKPDGSWTRINAPNALALLAFMGRGHVPGRGPYRDVLERGKKFIISTQREDGFYKAGGTMYNHGLATLAMAEMYGMDPDPKVEESLRKAIGLIIRAQSPAGGWRYTPNPGDQDMSVTIMQIVALRAASNAEIPVPSEVIRKALAFVHACSQPSGLICYQPNFKGSVQATAGGLLSLQLLGKYDDPQIPLSVDYLSHVPIEWEGSSVQFFYYFHYYAMQALYQAGGKHWNSWHPRIRELLLSKQDSDGSWDTPVSSSYEANQSVVGPNRIYSTAMACLILETYLHFLPVYQK